MPAFGADSFGDHGLARLDFLGDPDDVRRRAEEALRGCDADPRPGAHQEGADSSNSVWVTVDVAGKVVDVSISRRWRERIPGERLGEALHQAYSRAHEKRVAAAALAALGEPADEASADTSAEPFDPRMPDISDPHWLGWVWHSLGEAALRLDDLTAARPAGAPSEQSVTGPGGYVRLEVTGGAVTGVRVDALGFAERQPETVAADARAAFAAVHRGSRGSR